MFALNAQRGKFKHSSRAAARSSRGEMANIVFIGAAKKSAQAESVFLIPEAGTSVNGERLQIPLATKSLGENFAKAAEDLYNLQDAMILGRSIGLRFRSRCAADNAGGSESGLESLAQDVRVSVCRRLRSSYQVRSRPTQSLPSSSARDLAREVPSRPSGKSAK